MYNVVQARIVALCAAIAHAEGFFVPGALPRLHNNPGDLVGDWAVNGVFNSSLEGFDALTLKVAQILKGGSAAYSLTDTWRELAEKWTRGDHAGSWCDCVCDDLGVDQSTSLFSWIQATTQLQQTAPVQAMAPAPAPVQS